MKYSITKPHIGSQYIGKTFKYHSKYGGVIENILCEDVSITENIEFYENDVKITSYEVNIVSDKRNVYKLEEIEFYEKVN